MKHWPYRFKTKEEFIKEFGSDWRNEVRFSWINSMDYMFGEDYPYDISSEMCRLPDSHLNGNYYAISWNMIIKKEELKPNYKPRKINYYFD